MIQRGSAWSIAAVITVFVTLLPPVHAQDAKALLMEARNFYSRGKDTEALAKLKEVLASDPSSQEAWELRSALEFNEWARILVRDGEHAALVNRLFEKTIPAQREKARDPDTIRELIAIIDGDDFAARQQAQFTLLANHGEYAAPSFIARLDSDDSMHRAAAMENLRRLGVEAVLPLVQSLDYGSELARAGAVTVLSQLRDARGLPYVALVATEEGVAGDSARAALARAGMNAGDPVQMHLDLARRYYHRETAVVDPFRAQYCAWAAVDGALVAREVPKDVYHLKLAEEVLYDLLAVAPDNFTAHTLLASVLLNQAVVAGVLEDDNPAAPLTRAEEMAAALGGQALDAALTGAMVDGNAVVAAAAARLLGRLTNPDDYGQMPGLGVALRSGEKVVRYHAALAIAGLGAHAAAMESPSVVGVLAEALGEDAVRTGVVIDDNADSRNAIIDAFNRRGWFTYGSGNGALGLAAVRNLPIEDLVLVRYDLQAGTADAVIRQLRKDPRTESTVIAMIVNEPDMAKARELYGDSVNHFLSTAAEVEALEPGIRSEISLTDTARAEGIRIAAAAARALGAMPAEQSASAVSALIATLRGDDTVRVPACAALGRIGSSDALESLMTLMTDEGASDAARGAAAVAAGNVCSAMGEVDGSFDQALNAIIDGGDASGELLRHIGQAVGVAPYDAGARASVLVKLRARITIDTDEG